MIIFASMEKIFRHIETLLRRHDHVIVPGFGGFVYQHQSAVIQNDSIEPPFITISFNSLMNVSDGLLAIEFSRMERVSFREASVAIAHDVERFKSALKEAKKMEFGNLGYLTADDDRIIFSPNNKTHVIPGNYGLSTLHYAAAVKEAEERRVISFSLPPARKIARYAAVGAIAVGLFFAAPKFNDVTQNLANLFPTGQIKQSFEKEEPVQPIVIAMPYATEVNNNVAVNEQNTELQHHVIVSCMATQKDADELCEKLHGMNFSKAHTLPPIKTYRVSIKSFATKDEAVQFMQNLRVTNPQFADAWVLSDTPR